MKLPGRHRQHHHYTGPLLCQASLTGALCNLGAPERERSHTAWARPQEGLQVLEGQLRDS